MAKITFKSNDLPIEGLFSDPWTITIMSYWKSVYLFGGSSTFIHGVITRSCNIITYESRRAYR